MCARVCVCVFMSLLGFFFVVVEFFSLCLYVSCVFV